VAWANHLRHTIAELDYLVGDLSTGSMSLVVEAKAGSSRLRPDAGFYTHAQSSADGLASAAVLDGDGGLAPTASAGDWSTFRSYTASSVIPIAGPADLASWFSMAAFWLTDAINKLAAIPSVGLPT
jgi:hypothetical protein